MAGKTPGPDPQYINPKTHTLRTDAAHFAVYKAEAKKAGLSLNAYLVQSLARMHGLLPDSPSEQQLSLVPGGGSRADEADDNRRDHVA